MMSSRRRFLHVASAGALAWPLVRRSAARPPPPAPSGWWWCSPPTASCATSGCPAGEERDFQLDATMAPLEPFRDQLTIVDGLYNQAAERSRGPVGERGLATLLTGRERLPTGAIGPSLDQAVAQLPAGRSRPTLQLGVKTEGRGPGQVAISYLDTGQALLPEHSPAPGPAGAADAQRDPAPGRSGHGGGAGRHREEPGAGAAVAVRRGRPDAGGAPGGHHRAAHRVASTGSLCATLPGPALADSDDVATMGRAQIEVAGAGAGLRRRPRGHPGVRGGGGQRPLLRGRSGDTTTWRWRRAPTPKRAGGW